MEAQFTTKVTISKDRLVALTIAGYITAGLVFSLFGRILFPLHDDTAFLIPSTTALGDPSALWLLVVAAFVGSLSFLQSRGNLFGHDGHEGVSRIALWLNAIGSMGFCLVAPTGELLYEFPHANIWGVIALVVRIVVALMALAAPFGVVISILNIAGQFLGLYRRNK